MPHVRTYICVCHVYVHTYVCATCMCTYICVFVCSIGRPKHVRVMAGGLEGDVFIGPKAEVGMGVVFS